MTFSLRLLIAVTILPCFVNLAHAQHCPRGEAGLAFQERFENRSFAARTAKKLLTKDSDHDGVPNCLEKSLGLNSAVADSDSISNDGISPADAYRLLKLDSDGDGLSDAKEALLRTSPYLVDSDFDGLSDDAAIYAALAKCKIVKKRVKRKNANGKTIWIIKKVKVCKKTPSKTPTPKATAAPGSTPTPKPTSKPSATATPVPSGGNAATGKTFYSRTCMSCHGKKSGYSESQLSSALQSRSDHAAVRGLVNSQALKDIAAYLNSNL